MKKHQEEGLKGCAWITLGLVYLGVYFNWGIDAYIYTACGFCIFIGLVQLLVAAFTKDE